MKKQSIRLLLACTIALVLSGCATAHHSGACDYKVIYGNHNIPDLRLDPQIQKAAADGWKVVSSGGGDERPFVILCRPK
jgi:starvation-inducible outer membrane lipoprotein